MSEINLKPPKSCGHCNNKRLVLGKYICNYPVDKPHEIENFSAYQTDLAIRPKWCPIAQIVEGANQLPDSKKKLFNQMCDGIKALFELIDNKEE